jgi:hypothetical protein
MSLFSPFCRDVSLPFLKPVQMFQRRRFSRTKSVSVASQFYDVWIFCRYEFPNSLAPVVEIERPLQDLRRPNRLWKARAEALFTWG